jgi:glyoxylase-like metal-dependent hydrolase (beta-lactamase superfamily II)
VSRHPTLAEAESETVDDANRVVIRCVAVGPLRTNCYAVHGTDGRRSLLVDPGGNAPAILDAVSDLDIVAIVLTHTHWDHVEALAEVHDALGAPIAAHSGEAPVWPHEQDYLARHGHWDAGTATEELLGAGCCLQPPPGTSLWNGTVDTPVAHRTVVHVDRLKATVLHTPGHTPGGICLALPGHVLTGDTLFPGGPGLTGWPHSDLPTILDAIRASLFTLPGPTTVHPGHGPTTTIEREAPHFDEWAERGW